MTLPSIRNRSLIVTADGASNQTGFITLKLGGIVTIEAAGAISATVTLQRKGSDGNIVDVTDNSGTVTTFTKTGTYTLNPDQVGAQYRLNMKSGAYVSGQPITMLIEGR